MRKMMCSWYEASERATMGETCADQMTDLFKRTKMLRNY